MHKIFKIFGIRIMAFLLTVTTFKTYIHADENEIYQNDDKSVAIMVHRRLIDNKLELKFETNTAKNIKINDIRINDTVLKQGDYGYSYAVDENGSYTFKINYTRDISLKKDDESQKVVNRQATFEFKITVDELPNKEAIKDTNQETNGNNHDAKNPVGNKPTTIKGITIKTDEKGLKTLDAIPNQNDLDLFISRNEYILVDNETGVISIKEKKQNDRVKKRSADEVTVGQHLSSGASFYWKDNPSFRWDDIAFGEIFVNGEVAYCIEPSILNTSTGSASSTTLDNQGKIRVMDGRLNFMPSQEQKKNMELISNYGFSYPGHQTMAYRWATQILIFETLGWGFNSYGTVKPTAEMAEIQSLVAQHSDAPSWDGQTRQVKKGEIVDLSEVGVNKFTVAKVSGLEVVEDYGDTLKVRIIDKNASLLLLKKGGSGEGTSYVYSDGESQKVTTFKLLDPVRTNIKFEAKSHMQRVYKSGENGEPLANHKFRMSYTNTTDENGILTDGWDYVTGTDGFTPFSEWNNEGQTVYVQEIEAKAPYIRNTEIKSFVVTSGAETTMNFTNKKALGQFRINKYDNHGKRAIATYNILNNSNAIVGTVTTSLTDSVLSKELPLGKYKLQEISVNGNLVLNPKIFEVELNYKNQETPVVIVNKDFVNKYQRSNITITKIEDKSDKFNPEYHSQKLQGVELGIYAKADTYEGSTLIYRKGELIGKEVTNSVGQVTFHNVAIGEYEIKELKTIEGYQLFDGVWNVSVKYDGVNNTVDITHVEKTIENSPILGSVELVKSNGSGTQRLEGAVFGLYRGDKKLGTYTSDKDGRIVVEGLRYSTGNLYSFHEEKSPYGYWLNEAPIYFDITEQGKTEYLIAPNNLIEVHLEWNKTNEDGHPLAGVGFKIRNTQTGEFVTLSHADGKNIIEEDTWYTDANGDVFVKGLITAGKYELVEVAPLDGYQPIKPIKFTVDDKQDYIDLGTLVGLSLDVGDVVNYWNRGNLKITKLDSDTKEHLSNFGFNLYDSQNNLIGYYETGADGTVTINNLKHGYYVVEEVKVGGDYGIDPHKARQEVFIEEHGKTYEVTFENKHAEIKTNASFVERDKDETNIVTLVDVVKYTDLQVGKEYVLDGSLMYKDTAKPVLIDGELVKGQTVFTPTSKDGSVEVKFTFDANKLESKTLVVFEDLSREKQPVVVHHDINDIDQTIEIPEVGTTLTYTDRDKETPNIVTLTDEVRYSGLVVGKEYTVKGQLQDGVTGLPLLIDGKTVDGETTFVANQKDGVVNTKFTFDQNKLKTEKIVAFENLYEGNRLIATHADIQDKEQTIEIITYRILKKDIDTKNVLTDAEFTRYDLDGNIIEVLHTDANGVAEFKLFKGEVNTAKETGAPLGYKLSDEVVTMDTNLKEDGTLFVIEYYNELLPDDALPATGISNTPMILASVLILLGGLMMILSKRKFSVVEATTEKNSKLKWFKNTLNGLAVFASSSIILGMNTVTAKADVIDDLNKLWNGSTANIGRLLTLIGTVITTLATVILFIVFVVLLIGFVLSRRRGEDTSEKMMPLFGVLIGFAVVIALSAFGWSSLV